MNAKTVEDFFAKHGIVVEVGKIKNDEYWTDVVVLVDRKDYEKALAVEYLDAFPDCSVNVKQKTPGLVGANVGDLVLIYDNWKTSGEPIGLVTSKFFDGEKNLYGCRYLITPFTGYNRINDTFDFELTTENYGGYKEGFLAVLSQEQAVAHLRKLVDVGYEDLLKSLKIRHEKTVGRADEFFKELKANTQTIEFDKLVMRDFIGRLHVKVPDDFKIMKT